MGTGSLAAWGWPWSVCGCIRSPLLDGVGLGNALLALAAVGFVFLSTKRFPLGILAVGVALVVVAAPLPWQTMEAAGNASESVWWWLLAVGGLLVAVAGLLRSASGEPVAQASGRAGSAGPYAASR